MQEQPATLTAGPRGSMGEEVQDHDDGLAIDHAYNALKNSDPYGQQQADRIMRMEIAMRPEHQS